MITKHLIKEVVKGVLLVTAIIFIGFSVTTEARSRVVIETPTFCSHDRHHTACLKLPSVVRTKPEKYYDNNGRYLGRMDSDGRLYGADGRYQGRINRDGRVSDDKGSFSGTIRRQSVRQ